MTNKKLDNDIWIDVCDHLSHKDEILHQCDVEEEQKGISYWIFCEKCYSKHLRLFHKEDWFEMKFNRLTEEETYNLLNKEKNQNPVG